MIEQKEGYETVDQMIEKCVPKRNGVYSTVGTYPFEEMKILLEEYSNRTEKDANIILKEFGIHAFKKFAENYPGIIEKYFSPFDLIAEINDVIHVEVLKLYEDAELPQFSVSEYSFEKIELVYSSSRKLWAMAEGLMEGCFKYFKEEVKIEKEMLSDDSSKVKFTITKCHE